MPDHPIASCYAHTQTHTHTYIHTQRVLEVWDYEGGLTPMERGRIEAALRREVAREFRAMKIDGGPAPQWDGAFSQVCMLVDQAAANEHNGHHRRIQEGHVSTFGVANPHWCLHVSLFYASSLRLAHSLHYGNSPYAM